MAWYSTADLPKVQTPIGGFNCSVEVVPATLRSEVVTACKTFHKQRIARGVYIERVHSSVKLPETTFHGVDWFSPESVVIPGLGHKILQLGFIVHDWASFECFVEGYVNEGSIHVQPVLNIEGAELRVCLSNMTQQPFCVDVNQHIFTSILAKNIIIQIIEINQESQQSTTEALVHQLSNVKLH